MAERHELCAVHRGQSRDAGVQAARGSDDGDPSPRLGRFDLYAAGQRAGKGSGGRSANRLDRRQASDHGRCEWQIDSGACADLLVQADGDGDGGKADQLINASIVVCIAMLTKNHLLHAYSLSEE